MSENWIKKWYKDSSQKASTEGPKDEVWQNIDSQLDDWAGYWYSSNAEKIKENPNLRVWHNLNRIIETAINQRRYARFLRFKNMGIISLFLIIPFVFVDATNILSTRMNRIAIEYGSSEHQPETNPIIALVNTNFATENTSRLSSAENNLLAVSSAATVSTKSVTTESPSIDNQKLPSHVALRSLNYNQPDRFRHTPLNKGRKMKFSKWSIGGSINIQQSSLLNPTSAQGLQNNSSITNLRSSHIVFNGTVARRLTSNSSLELAVAINDSKCQKHKDFVGSEYIEKNLTLNYQTIRLMYNQRLFSNHLNRRIGFEVSGGVYGSVRTNISEQWAGEDRNFLMPGFKSYDFGLRSELNGTFALNEHLDLRTGLYYSNGLVNIFDGIESIPSHFYRTFTSSFGVSVGVRYSL